MNQYGENAKSLLREDGRANPNRAIAFALLAIAWELVELRKALESGRSE